MISKEDFEKFGYNKNHIINIIGITYFKELSNSWVAIVNQKTNDFLIKESLGKKDIENFNLWDTLYEGPIKDIKELKKILKKLLI